jgi:hypothetical protein
MPHVSKYQPGTRRDVITAETDSTIAAPGHGWWTAVRHAPVRCPPKLATCHGHRCTASLHCETVKVAAGQQAPQLSDPRRHDGKCLAEWSTADRYPAAGSELALPARTPCSPMASTCWS